MSANKKRLKYKFIVINARGSINSHIPPTVGSNYETICGMDGNDLSDDVQQSVIGESDKLDCPQCIGIFDAVSICKERDILRLE